VSVSGDFSIEHCEAMAEGEDGAVPPKLLLFSFTLVTGLRRLMSLKLSDTRVYEPQIRPGRRRRGPPETRNLNPGTRNRHPKPETRNPNPGTRIPEPETRNPKPSTRNPDHRSRIPEPGARSPNPKPETRNPKPGTRNFKPGESRDGGRTRASFLLFFFITLKPRVE